MSEKEDLHYPLRKSENSDDRLICIICKKGSATNKKLVDVPNIELVKDLKYKVTERFRLGDLHLKSLAEHLSSLSESDLNNVSYHSECRKPLANKANLENCRKRNYQFDDVTTPPKRGRPQKTDTTETSRSLRGKESGDRTKERCCIFNLCSFCPRTSYNLHKIKTYQVGQQLLNIRKHTKHDAVLLSLSELEDYGDALALDKYYHRHCMRDAERSTNDPNKADVLRHLINVCDAEVVLYVRESLLTTDCFLTMNEINEVYLSLLKEKNIHQYTGNNRKKYLKGLIKQHVADVEFIDPLNPNNSQRVMRKRVVLEAVDAATNDTSVSSLLALSQVLRNEVLHATDWTNLGT